MTGAPPRRRASLRARMTLAFGALALTLAIVSAVAIASLTRLGGAIATILRENYASVIACEDMKEALERQDSAALFAATGHVEIAAPLLEQFRAAFAGAYDREARNVTLAGEGELVRAIGEDYRGYVAAVDRALRAPRTADRLEAYFRELLPRFTRVKDGVQRVLRLNQSRMELADGNASAMARRSVRIALAVCAVAGVLALWFALRLPRTVVRPLRTLAAAARAIGAGDLDVAVVDPDVHELDPLVEAFRKMVLELRAYRQSSLGELLAAQDLAQTTVACLLDPVVVLGRDGSILLTNTAAERAFGLRVGDAAELRAAEVAVPEAFAAARDRALATGEPVAPRNLAEAMRWRDRGGERFFLVRAALLRAEPGDAARVIVVAEDVTRFRRIDELKTGMVATVSHEFKTPLTSLRMATHLLLEPATGPLTEAQREVVTTARDETERLRALVDELLDLVRIEAEAGALRRVAFDVRRLLQPAVDAHRAIARDKGVRLDVDPGDALPPARIDPEKLAIVLANLVSNAVRHTPPAGRVTLGATADAAAHRITVRDTGEGIASDSVPRLLERGAARATPAGGARHGLGLTIAQEIVLQHGGQLDVRSEVGVGSTFTVVLPRERAGEGGDDGGATAPG